MPNLYSPHKVVAVVCDILRPGVKVVVAQEEANGNRKRLHQLVE